MPKRFKYDAFSYANCFVLLCILCFWFSNLFRETRVRKVQEEYAMRSGMVDSVNRNGTNESGQQKGVGGGGGGGRGGEDSGVPENARLSMRAGEGFAGTSSSPFPTSASSASSASSVELMPTATSLGDPDDISSTPGSVVFRQSLRAALTGDDSLPVGLQRTFSISGGVAAAAAAATATTSAPPSVVASPPRSETATDKRNNTNNQKQNSASPEDASNLQFNPLRKDGNL
jgi:hypothetical protein